jgi:hypothetical protein
MGPMKRAILMMAIASLAALPAFADTFTSSTSFNAAVSALSPTTANFDSDSVGNVANGSTVDGITFSYTPSAGNDSLAIVSTADYFDTTSEPNYLGTNDPGTAAFFPGDIVSMSFASPINALGMFIIGGPFSDNDFALATPTVTAFSSSVLETTLGDGGEVIFLGLTSTAAFSSATITLNSSAGELWNLDDIVTAAGTPGNGNGGNGGNGGGNPLVPEPSTLALFAIGLAVCARRAWKMSAPQAELLS